MRLAARVRAIVAVTETGAGGARLSELLSRSLGDPSVRVTYPAPDGVRGSMRPVSGRRDLGGPNRSLTTIEREGAVVAVVEHEAGLDPDLLAREVGAAARLAVENERLHAAMLAQLRDLRASRARIVAASDSAAAPRTRPARRRAAAAAALSFELRLAVTAASASEAAPTRAARGRRRRGRSARSTELRDLAHGIYPAVLAEAGLGAGARDARRHARRLPVELRTWPARASRRPSSRPRTSRSTEAVDAPLAAARPTSA